MPIVVVGNVFVDIKGFPEGNYIPAGRNAGKIEIVHGGVGRNVAEDIANLELRPRFVSMVDESAEGGEVVRKLKNHKTDVDYVVAVPDGMGMWLAVFDSSGDIAGSISKRPNMLPLVDLLEEKGDEIFRESDSTFFCRIRDLFSSELKTMYNTLESQNAWHAESFINDADAWQAQFPEELWRLDIERKYIRTYTSTHINGEGDSQFLVNMANGKMKYPVKQWERSQEKYMASKYQSSLAANDNAVLRCATPEGTLVVPRNYRLKLTPYDYVYLNVAYGTTSPIQLRAEPNITYEIPFTGDSTDIISIYSASCLRSLGDLSTCYPATVDTIRAIRIKELIVGNETDGYDNPYFTTLSLGANPLLEVLNLENVSGLTQSLELSLLTNLRELYAHGTNSKGVVFANAGKIEIAELPAITSMTMKNLIYLTTLDVTDFSKLTTLTVENCNTIDLLTIFNSAPNLNRVRVIGVDWTLEDTSLLERIYEMSGIDKNGYNADQSVLSGTVHVPVIRQQQLYNYQQAWSDLEIVADTIIEQFAIVESNSTFSSFSSIFLFFSSIES